MSSLSSSSVDEPLFSAKRVWFGIMLWLAMHPVYVSFWRMVVYHRRPNACRMHDERKHV